MAKSPYTRFLAVLRRVPRGWTILGMFFISGILWVLIIYGITLIASAGECMNGQVTAGALPPAKYRHEPNLPYRYMSAEFLNAMIGEQYRKGGQVLGFYGKKSGIIWICEGLTGKALRIIRMHEEAHAMGWRH